jgi:hypothetical protein
MNVAVPVVVATATMVSSKDRARPRDHCARRAADNGANRTADDGAADRAGRRAHRLLSSRASGQGQGRKQYECDLAHGSYLLMTITN